MKKDNVLCLVIRKEFNPSKDIQDNWRKLSSYENITFPTTIITKIIPLINHLHNDIENGQLEPHYHADSNYFNKHIYQDTNDEDIRVYPNKLKPNESLEYISLYKFGEYNTGITPTKFIKNSKLKHKCIHKGKCPHRGMDLTNVLPNKEGIITYPLHGLQFNNKTKQLLTKL